MPWFPVRRDGLSLGVAAGPGRAMTRAVQRSKARPRPLRWLRHKLKKRQSSSASNSGDSGLVFPSHITGQCYHASPLQQDWIRRAGWCLVACPRCGAEPGERCKGMKQTNRKRPRISVDDGRREAATAAGFGSIGWHTFRHKYRTLLSEADTPLEVQQKLLRHADIRTTTQYGNVHMENKRAANSAAVRGILIRRSSR
jgi:integrase